MPQKRTEIPEIGIWPALRGAVLSLVKGHRAEANALVKAAGSRTRTVSIFIPKPQCWTEPVPDHEVLESLLSDLALIAVEPTGKLVREVVPQATLFKFYANAPDLTLAVLVKARAIWFKDSKATRLWRWLASNEGIQPLPHKPRVSVWECTDCQLATGYELATDEPVSPFQVEKARKRLAADIKRGKRMAASGARNFPQIPSV